MPVSDTPDWRKTLKRRYKRTLRAVGLLPPAAPVPSALGKLEIAYQMFLPAYYRRAAGLSPSLSEAAAWEDFRRRGLKRGLLPSPLFDPQFYVAAAAEAGLPPLKGSTPFEHWLDHGVPARIVPTPLFDEAFYLRSYQDIAEAKVWGFRHFVEYGVHEGRQPYPMSMIVTSGPLWRRSREELPLFYRLLLSQHEPGEDGADALFRSLSAPHGALVGSVAFRAAFARAAALEADLGDLDQLGMLLYPPLHDILHFALQDAQERLPKPAYDIVLCVPFALMGGADLTAGLLARALRNLWPEADILLLRTDRSDFERPDWFPVGIDVVDLSDIVGAIGARGAERLFYALLMGVGPKAVFNVNSLLCWNTLRRFGSRLAQSMDLYAYLFCWDQTPSGQRVGYPSMFFTDTVASLAGIFTDSEFLRAELTRLYQLPRDVRGRLLRLYTPSAAALQGGDAGEAADRPRRADTPAESGRRPLILWAGRFDRQKRFDLLLRIAAAMPHVDFHVWGKHVLDRPGETARPPRNLRLHPPFVSHDELPLRQATGWLYTSAWDGLPNILVEIGSRGVAVAASAVGGVPELIDDGTGWLVREPDLVEAYVAAIDDMIARPQERLARAARLRQRVLERHDPTRYERELRDFLSKGGRLCPTSPPS